jgi:hypothetical protein
MKTKPKHLNVLAAVILGAAVSLPIQIMLLYGHPPTEMAAIAAKLTPLNWMILFYCPVVAYLVWRVSPLLIAAVPVLGALVVYNNWFVGQIGTDYSPWVTAVASLAFCCALAGIFTSDVRRVVMNPSLRWWMVPQRTTVELPVRLRVLNGSYKSGREEFYTITFDVSESGAFIPFGRERGSVREIQPANVTAIRGSEIPGEAFSMRSLVAGTQCYVCLSLGELAFIHCRAEVVRVAQPAGRYPAGVAIRFLGLTGQEKRMISSYMEDLEDEAREERTSNRLAA